MPSPRTILPLDRWSLLVLATALLLLSCIAWVDYVTIWPMLLFYLLPQLLVATLMRGVWWLPLAFFEAGVWLFMRYKSPPPGAVNESLQTALWTSMQPLGVLLVVGFLCARLRQFSRSPGSFTSSHDSSGLLSAGGLQEAVARRLNAERVACGPVALLLLSVDRSVSAFAGQSTEYAALVGAMIGKVVLDHARASDLCVRLSPNHFLVVMPGADQTAAATLDAAIQDLLPEVTRSLDDSITVTTLLLYSPGPVPDFEQMRSYAETRLTTLKVLGMGRNHSETWPPTQARPTAAPPGPEPVAGLPLTTG